MHTSQRVITDDENEYRIALEVIPNYELIQQILKYGDTVKVVEPEWLVDEIKAILTRSLDQY